MYKSLQKLLYLQRFSIILTLLILYFSVIDETADDDF